MLKVAIIGSCVSRDNFNSCFIEDYKRYYSCVVHQNQMSIISLTADSIAFDYEKIDNLKPFDKRQFETELDKSILNTLIINEPNYLILDFYADVFYGIRELEGSTITNKRWLFSKTTLYKTLKEGESLSLLDDFTDYFERWKESIKILFDFLNRKLPNCKVVVNKARFSDIYYDEISDSYKYLSKSTKVKQINTSLYNEIWDRLDNYVIKNHDVQFIDYGDKYYLLDSKHKWGLFYLHYVKDFYLDFTKKFLSIITSDFKNILDVPRIKIKENKEYNLIKNPTFTLGKSNWSFWQNEFEIKDPDSDKQECNVLSISKRGLEKDANSQLWSNAIEINADGYKEFELSFDIRISEINLIDSYKCIFSIRMFDSSEKYLQKDAVWFRNVKTTEIKDLSNNRWLRYTLKFKPEKGKYIKVGPYLPRNGHVSWRDIKLLRNF
ncbi:DUF6270 domain-containing protein [Bacillus paralicheniformis]|uniref:DUF6270 domain-containing protein n=1 Tax=Bacillus paralicheniformis TaxID=1648923 RepID=UPI00034248BD|nr:DUF6270 domain-containing protein [Bacillus paralicheniformis]KUL05884.1 hypothetical protein LI7559_22630 [Bacillus licheniformis LMG 7559]AGN38134.1 hypothetical protein BaLi_c38200 [Bacillus paralicheniformis ATCC 9945a]ARA87417.1 hypothetical protein BLMD_19070 [Bacillus paralicheniformis]AYQ18188.1 hypothetical protein D5285_20040 [Bacillus paralicheniformis]KND05228.1 hypothetical protein ACJ43_22875 [Bacillus paralicheniformis]